MKSVFEKISIVAFVIGSILLLINIYGLFIPLGNDDIYSNEHVLHKNDIEKDAQPLLKEVLEQEKIVDRKVYFKKVVHAVNKNMAHYWWGEGRTKYNLTIPIYENYIIWFKQYTNPDIYKFYEFCNYNRALERKVGLCSQHALIVDGILKDKNIPSKIVRLTGHLVVMAEVSDDENWILDSDYDVIVPFSLAEIEKDSTIIIPFYENNIDYSSYAISQVENNKGQDTDVNILTLNQMINIYGKKGNSMADGVEEYWGDKCFYESMSYYLIWLIPLILILPLFMFRIKAYKRNVALEKK